MLSIPESESEHSPQVFHAVIAKFFVGMNDGLRVTIRSKVMPLFLEIFPEIAIIVDFPIEDDHNIPIFVENRLIPSGYIND